MHSSLATLWVGKYFMTFMHIAYHKQKILLKISELETIALLWSLFLYSFFYKHMLTSKDSVWPPSFYFHKIKQSYGLMMNKAYEMGQDLHIQHQFWKSRAKCSIQNWKHHLGRFQSRNNKPIFLESNSCTTYQLMQTVKKKKEYSISTCYSLNLKCPYGFVCMYVQSPDGC